MRASKKRGIMVISCLFVLLFLTSLGGMAVGNASDSDLAIKGYDAVAYFKAGKALKGSEAFRFRWHDMTWHFASKGNRDLFAAGPEKYAPQYDGYCAWAMSEGRKAIVDPTVWEIVNGKLYLQCSQAAYEKWRRDVPGNIKKGDENWRKLNKKD